jgi:colanic acid biosynthesis glycosyl transferase WcaI
VFPILLLRHDLNAKIVYNIQDMFPGSAAAAGVLASRVLQTFFSRFQRLAYKNSDAVTVISEDMRLKVIEQGVPDEKVRVIVKWYDDRAVREVAWDKNRFVTKYGLSRDDFYVQYAGTMGIVFDDAMVLQVAERLRDFGDIVFQMIGTGSRKDAFMKAARERGLFNIVFYPLEPQDMVADVYSACSVCLIPLKRGVIGNSVPSKAALLMAVKRPIVSAVDEDSSYFRMFQEGNMGVAVSTMSPDGVAEAILNLYKNPAVRELYASNGKAYGEKFYNRKVNTKLYINLFEELNGKK